MEPVLIKKTMESSTVDADWMEFFRKSGELLFYYNKVTAEHRWPDSCTNSYENGTPIYGRPLICVGTQTEDYGCSNGCASVHVDGGLLQPNHVEKEDNPSAASSQMEIHEGMLLASEESGNVVFDGDSEIQVMAEVTTDCSPEGTTESSVSDGCQLAVTCSESVSQNNQQCGKDQQLTCIKGYQCKICGNRFTHILSFCHHELLHTGAKPFKCKTCGKAFKRKAHLKRHENIHTGKKTYKCKTCEKAFADSSSRRYHELLHTGAKPFKCKACGKAFKRKAHLKRHESTHTGIKP